MSKATATITNLDELPAVLTPQQVADTFQLPLGTVYDLAQRGALPRVKLGRLVRFSKTALLEYLESQSRDSIVPASGM